jgi:ABC-2 type transport system permease protein
MFRLLMRTRLLAAKNTVKEAWRLRPVVTIVMAISAVGLFTLMYAGSLFFFDFAAHLGVLKECTYQAFYYLFLLLLAGAVPFVASTLLLSNDYNLLFSAPVPPRAVVAGRLLDATVTNSLQFAILGIPSIVAAASAARISIAAWFLVPILIALFVLLPALFTALALLVALACFGIGKVRAAITLVNVLMGICVCITFVLEARNLPLKFNTASSGLNALQPSLTATSHAAHIAPSHWFADALLSLSTHSNASAAMRSFLPLTLLVVALFGICIGLGARMLSISNLTEEAGNSGSQASGFRSHAWRSLVNARIGSLIAKDLRFLWRDSMLVSQLAVPLILFAVPFLLALQNRGLDPITELYPFSAAIIGFILYMQTSILALSLLGMESQSFWIVLASPTMRRSLLLAKWAVSSLVSGGIGLALSVLAAIAFHAPLHYLTIQMALILCSSGALCGLGIGISAIFPRFHHENPAMRVSTWALILGFFASTGYVLSVGTIFGVAYYFAASESLAIQSRRIWMFGALLYLALTLAAIVIPLILGTLRIERYEWEH